MNAQQVQEGAAAVVGNVRLTAQASAVLLVLLLVELVTVPTLSALISLHLFVGFSRKSVTTPDSQGQNHRVNELVVTGITKHLPKGMGKTQTQPLQMEMPIVVEATETAKPKRKPRKGIIRVGAAI